MKWNTILVRVFLIYFVTLSCKNSSNFDVETFRGQARKSKGELFSNKTHFNYGKIKKGQVIIKHFLFYNKGEEDVNIIDFQTSCGCTEFKITKNIIKPKDSVSMEMKIDTNEKEFGVHEVYSIVTTNDERETYILRIKFEVN